MNIGCRIVSNIERPDISLIEQFKGLPVPNIDDCMNRTAAPDQRICPVSSLPLLGPAFTVKVAQGDNLMFHKALDLANPGDVIVIDSMGTTNRAIFGEIMVKYLVKRGIAGVIVDGPIRDLDALREIGIPIYATGTSPNGPYKNGPGEIGTIISFGGITVHPGDIVVGDQDGLVFVRPEEAADLADLVKEKFMEEERIMATIDKEGTYERPWVDQAIEKIGCEYVDS